MREVSQPPLHRFDQAPLLAIKLFIPRVREGLVPRPHLVERLNACLRHPLTLISAPAGFGKTTLAADWVRDLSPSTPAAWLSLDEADDDPTRFLTYLIAALQQVVPGLGRDLRSALESSSAPPAAAVIAALINDLLAQRPPDFVLVLDDFHSIDDSTIHAAMRELVAHGPPQLHLVLTTRRIRSCSWLGCAPAASSWSCAGKTCASAPRRRPSSCAMSWGWRSTAAI